MFKRLMDGLFENIGKLWVKEKATKNVNLIREFVDELLTIVRCHQNYIKIV